MDVTAEERERIRPYVTSVDAPVFALVNLPETVKGALFARYSRSPKSLRRLLLDEFLTDTPAVAAGEGPGARQADALYDRVLSEYGDDSVAQLGSAHVAVEGVSNVLTKVLQWGRVASYLEQSTRYIAYTDRPGGRWRYHRPAELDADAALARHYVDTLDRAFAIYADMLPRMVDYWDGVVPGDADRDDAHRRAVRARALDSVRGLLPAATISNMGIMASGQAYEALIVRLRAHPLAEARACGDMILAALREVIPAFLTRVDRPDRGERYGRYMEETRRQMAAVAHHLWPEPPHPGEAQVRLVDFDPDAEERVVTHALWPHSGLPLATVRQRVHTMTAAERRDVLAAYRGRRSDRREKPGRALEATTYTFEVVCDYGAYRDLQRHRMLSLQVQPLSPRLGWQMPDEIAAAGVGDDFATVMAESGELHDAIAPAYPHVAPYAVSLAHRVRFTMVMNAREAMHLIELRSQPQGHISYRQVAQQMQRAIDEVAGHHAIAEMMSFTDHSGDALGRLAAERRTPAAGSSTLEP